MCTRAELQQDRTRGSQVGASFLQPAERDNKEGTAGKAACPKTSAQAVWPWVVF